MNRQSTSPHRFVSVTDEAAAIRQELETCLQQSPGGGPNPEAVREIERLCLQLKSISGAFAEKASGFAGWSRILYSPGKHIRWSNPYQSGAQRIVYFMRCDLASMDSIL